MSTRSPAKLLDPFWTTVAEGSGFTMAQANGQLEVHPAAGDGARRPKQLGELRGVHGLSISK